MATYLPSNKSFKSDKKKMQGTTGETKMNS